MAKSTLPQFVTSALSIERRAQIGTYAAVALYVFDEVKNNREVNELGDRLHQASPFRTLKTWQNYATACASIANHPAVVIKLEALWSQSDNMGELAAHFEPWLEAQLKTKGYTSSVDDVGAWAKGRPSIKAKAKAEKDEQTRMEAANQAAILEAAKNPPAPVAPTVDGDPVNPLPALPEPVEATGDEAEAITHTTPEVVTGYAPVIKGVIESVMRAYIDADELCIIINPKAIRADLVQILETIQAQIDMMEPEASTLPILDLEMV